MPDDTERAGHAVVLADTRQARLLICGFDERDRLRLSEMNAIRNAHESEHEHGRPEILGRRSGETPQSVAQGGTKDEETRRFSREIAVMVRSAIERHGVIGVLAGPKLLGLLRQELGETNRPIDLREGDLAGFTESELQDHPAMIETVRELRRRTAAANA